MLAEPRCVGLSGDTSAVVIEFGGFGVTFNGVFNPSDFEGQYHLMAAFRLPPSSQFIVTGGTGTEQCVGDGLEHRGLPCLIRAA